MIATCLSLTLSLAAAAQACAGDGPPEQGRARRVPPPEAFEACDGKKAGDKVTFTTPRGEKISGTCTMMPARLVASPDRPPQQGANQAGGNPPGGSQQAGNPPPPRPN
jgi:hypothetical protein